MSDLFEDAATDASLAGIEPPSDRWPSTLAELVDVLRALFVKRGRSEDDAISEAQQAALAIGEYLGGRQIYLPCGDSLRGALRDRRIYLEYNGRNKADLSRRYGITERRVEQIAAEQRVIFLRKMQGSLFDS
ncbi:Mor transcription activator family protein [Dyella terrae]|uniref:Mor transcription activator family protein n=1 Tax=Dyella terrae TaxID=522259 RepID=UPI001EFE298C|nr:Mor transcription activator family protein [Dyella terrae]ULU26612.1 transcriptional regulator [Dyella terrae]